MTLTHPKHGGALKRKRDGQREETRPLKVRSTELAKPSTEAGAAWRTEHAITIRSPTTSYVCPDPMLSFDDTPFSNEIKACLAKAGYTKPTPTQAQSWPIAIAKHDMISVAKTGSGKTVGFLLPSFYHLAKDTKRHRAPRILVLAPTRELATQIEAEAKKFGSAPPYLRTACVYGGAPKGPQIRQLSAGVDCLVACPGRLKDFMQANLVQLSSIEILVLDEADRMLDMGFEPQIRFIVAGIPTMRQTLLFSATWPKAIQKLANEFLQNPVQVEMGDINVLQANKDIEQTVTLCDFNDKYQHLLTVMDEAIKFENPTNTDLTNHVKTIVFFRTKRLCHSMAQEYWNHGYAVGALHGDMDQYERTSTMEKFKTGELKLLFATDVAARGLDVKDVGVVINYDMPSSIEDYVHRIGRTGRAGAKGRSISFFTPDDAGFAKELIEILTSAEQSVPKGLHDYVGKTKSKSGGGKGKFKGGSFHRQRGGGRRY
ncbi:hypothetical protein ACHHYP_03925 [Achlya hypogyna]|uniref:RNA helicase n=1 Tax=Achlya hypogyna TaxID=1202772 RepID=A0A1V9Z2Y8_ACHHY|nr:hypothetical protein ACHHYP_03925 [Achlya hypogyna]